MVFSVIPSSQLGREHEDGVLDLLTREDAQPRLEDEPAPERARRADRQRGRRRDRLCGRRALAEDVQERGDQEREDKAQEDPAEPEFLRPLSEIAVALEDDRVRNVGHAAPFGGKKGCPARLHWSPEAPVAQGIERCPAEAEVASSNLAGRT